LSKFGLHWLGSYLAETADTKDFGVQDGTAELVGQTQPTGTSALAQVNPFDGVDLPNLVGPRGPWMACSGPDACWRRSQASPREPTLQRARAGQMMPGPTFLQKDPDVTRSPTGMLTPEVQSKLEDFLIWPGLLSPAMCVRRSERPWFPRAKPPDQMADSARMQSQGIGNLGNGLATLPAPEQNQTNRNGYRPSHRTSRRKVSLPKPSAYSSNYEIRCRAAARQNLVSELAAKLDVR